MPFNVLLLPLLGGYLFLTHWNRTRFATKRYSGERLIFHSAIAGVVLLCVSFATVRGLIALRPDWYGSWREVVPFDYTGTSFGAFVLGAISWAPLNKWLFPMERERLRVIQDWGDHLEELLEEAIQSTKQIALSMKSGKVYIGFPVSNIDPAYDRRYVNLLPVSSGYRDPETQSMVLTTDYAQVYLQLVDDEVEFKADDFNIILPVGEISSANIFDPKAYERFNAAGTSAEGEE